MSDKLLAEAVQDELDRQIVLLALAELALSRPGMDLAAREIARQFGSEEMFDGFKRSNADRVKHTHKPFAARGETTV
jgi:hypothetical protein